MSTPEGPAETIATLIHSELCNDGPECGRWVRETSDHRKYYHARARAIVDRLEPEIGIANVFFAVSVILDEVL